MCPIKATVFLIFTFSYWLTPIFTYQNPNTDSILDLINTKRVEKLLAERRQNMSRNEKRYLLENELDDYQSPSQEYDYPKLLDGDTEVFKNTENPRIDIDLLFRRNNISDPYRTTELLSDLRGFAGRKVLKSSKNALYVTRKEYLRKDWCKSEPLVQKIKEEGCLTRTIINRFCYGQCNSFYIPKNPKRKYRRKVQLEENEDEDQNGPAFKSCGFCSPMKFTWITVVLHCPSMTPQYKKKRVQRIKQCKCVAANLN